MYPLFSLILSIGMVGIIILESVMQQQILRRRLIATLIVSFTWVALYVVYDSQIVGSDFEQYVNIYAALTYGGFALVFFLSLKEAINTHSHYQSFISSIGKTRFNAFISVDGKEKIRDISTSLIEELGVKKEDIIGKKLFDIFDKTIRFTKINDVEINNQQLREYYQNYKKTVKPNTQEKIELQFLNYNGTPVVLNMVEEPIFVMNKYQGRIQIGEKKSQSSLMNVEKELLEKNKELESIRYKFIATLEMTEEGLFYIDLDEKYIWGTDQYMITLGISSNTISIEDYQGLMNREDLIKYASELQSLTPQKPRYSISYRYLKNGEEVWIKEVGKRIFEDENANVILGFIKTISNDHYERSNIPELDNIKDDIELQKDIQRLLSNHRMFEVVTIKLVNIPEINEKYNRAVGNMMMGEYIRKLKQNFMSENSKIYRISGLEFVLTITDVRKIDVLRRMLESDKTSLNLPMEYGSIKETVIVNVGISISNEDADTASELINCSKTALKVAERSNTGYFYYKDMK